MSFVAGLFYMIFGTERSSVSSEGSDTFSVSALGHQALVELLGELGVPVLVSQYDSAQRAGDSAVLIVAEPLSDLLLSEPETVAAMLTRMGPTILILPKWRGSPDYERSGWVSSAELMDKEEIRTVLEQFSIAGNVVHVASASELSWFSTEIDVEPVLTRPQLLNSPNVVPIVSTHNGVLVGRVERVGWGPLYVVSDPDPFATHGLGQGDNAILAVSIIDLLRDEGSVVVIDETLHGHQVEPTIYRELFQFPLVLAVIAAVLVMLTLLWKGALRFGDPVPPRPAIEPGKAFLIENTADLLRFGGDPGHALRHYFINTIQDVGRALHAPAHLDTPGLRAWLMRVGSRRDSDESLMDLEKAVKSVGLGKTQRHQRLVMAMSHRIHNWRQEMIGGSRRNSNNQ